MDIDERRALTMETRIALLEQDVKRLVRDVDSFRMSTEKAVSGLRIAMIVAFAAVGVALLIIGGSLLLEAFTTGATPLTP